MCENCKNLFDIKKNLPYLIPCGHTICERCLNSLDFKNNRLKCPIDSRIYETTKEKIPRNEMLIDYMQSNKLGPKYSYQIREMVIEEATFCRVDRRNCCQKLCHQIYILIYVKIILTILNIIFWPFKKVYQLIKKILNLLYRIFLKIKEFCIKIINKIKSIHLPKINANCKFCIRIKDRIVNSKLIKTIIKFFKYTIRAPLWINYLKIMKNLIYESQAKVNNICFKAINVILAIMGILLAHLIAYLTNNLENFFIILLLLNESTIVLVEFMKMDDEKDKKRYLKNNRPKNNVMRGHSKRKSDFGIIQKRTFEEEDEEYLIDENKYHRGKKCINRWIGFILFWYFYPMIKQYIYDFIKYRQYSKDIDIELQEKNIKIWIGIVNSLFLIPKLLIVIYLTC